MTSPPACWNSDHFYRGGGVCSQCDHRLRCYCGRFLREETMAEHYPHCPTLLSIQREREAMAS